MRNLPLFQTVVTIFYIIISIYYIPSTQMPVIIKWIIGLSIPILIVIYFIPYFRIRIKNLAEKRQQRRKDRLAAQYYKKLVELSNRFMALIDSNRSDAIPRVTKDILNDIPKDQKGDDTYYKYNLIYNLFKEQLEFISNLKPDVSHLRIGIGKFNAIIDTFLQLYIDRSYNNLEKCKTGIEQIWLAPYNSTMSNLERLIQEFNDLCENAQRDFTNMPYHGNFIVRKLKEI